MHDWYVLRSGGEEDGPGSGDGGTEADRYLQGGVHLRGEYITEFESVFLLELPITFKGNTVHVLYSLTSKNSKVL